MKRYSKYILLSLLTLFACQASPFDDDVIVNPNDGMVTIPISFGNDFASSGISTRTGEPFNIATSRELNVTSAVVFVFENKNPIKNTEGVIIQGDPNGKLLQFMVGEDVAEVENQYKAELLEMEGVPVTVLGIANVPLEIYQDVFDAYDLGNTPEGFAAGDYVTLEKFSEMTVLELKTEIVNGKTAVATTERTLRNSDDAYLPISIDPVFLTELTQEKVDEKIAAGAFDTQFGYTRVDVVVEPEAGGNVDDIELVEACLVNIPTKPLYFGDPSSVSYADRTLLVNRSTNINTKEQDDAESATNYHLIQGLYSYPMIIQEGVTTQKASAVIKAKTSVSVEPGGEYYKVLIQYNRNSTMGEVLSDEELSLYRDTRYRLVIREFTGNGYKTLEEAIDGEPSNVKYEIIVDPDRGNEFVLTNGTIYMALSNTRVDLFGEGANLTEKEFTAFTVFYNKNSDAGNINDPKKYIGIDEGDDIGIEVVDMDSFNDNVTENNVYKVKMKITNPALFASKAGSVAHITVRIGDLVQKITFTHIPFSNEATTIDRYVSAEGNSDYALGYFTPEEPNDYKAWILFDGNNVMEYNPTNGNGIPLSFTSLQQGQRDNFECPIYAYNKDGSSTRVLVYQESFETIDFSDKEFVEDFLNITSAEAGNELVLSNCYILNPSSTQTRKFIIPVEDRINEFLSNTTYVSAGETAPYSTLPSNWQVKTSWYDSQRIHDGGLVFSKEIVAEGEQQSISVLIPANFQKFGTMLVTVYVPAAKDDDGNVVGTDTNLWHWTIWVTDYDPYTILQSSAATSNVTGTGVFIVSGEDDETGTFVNYENVIPGTSYAGANKYNSALHRYQGGNWDSEPAEIDEVNFGSNIGRFIMDRNNGASAATFAGHGGVMDASTGMSTSNPLSGWLSYQTGNIVPYPGAGAVYADGTSFAVIGTKEYASIRKAIQNPQNYYYGSGKYTFSTWLDNRAVTGADAGYSSITSEYVGYDVTLPKDESSSYNKKGIFDASPLGFMTPSYFTFHATNSHGTQGEFISSYTSTYLSHDVAHPLNTAAVYRNFAYFYYVGFRTSGGGAFRLGKNYLQGSYLRVTRPNKWWSTWSSFFAGAYNNSTAKSRPGICTVADAGDGGAISLRPVTQFRYD